MQRKREIVDLWRLLACMTGETQFVDGKFVPSSVVPPEDAYKSSYRKMDLQLRKSFVRGARQFLGAQYYETICSRLARRSVNRAVVPNVIDDIQNYVKYIITPSLNIANPQVRE